MLVYAHDPFTKVYSVCQTATTPKQLVMKQLLSTTLELLYDSRGGTTRSRATKVADNALVVSIENLYVLRQFCVAPGAPERGLGLEIFIQFYIWTLSKSIELRGPVKAHTNGGKAQEICVKTWNRVRV